MMPFLPICRVWSSWTSQNIGLAFSRPNHRGNEMNEDDEEDHEVEEEKRHVRVAREQLNELLLLVDLPQITHIADASPNLLIALFESLVERRVRLDYRGNTASHAKLRNVTVLLNVMSNLVGRARMNIDPRAVCRKDRAALHSLIQVLTYIAVLRGKIPFRTQHSKAYTESLGPNDDDLGNITSHYEAIEKVRTKENTSLSTLPSPGYHQHSKIDSLGSLSSLSTPSSVLRNPNAQRANSSAKLIQQRPSRRVLKMRQTRPVFLSVASSRGSNTSFSTISLSSITSDCQSSHHELSHIDSTPRISRMKPPGRTPGRMPGKATGGMDFKSPMIYPLHRYVEELSDASRPRNIPVDSPRTTALRRKRNMALRALQGNENVRHPISTPSGQKRPSEEDELAQLERHLHQLGMIKQKQEERQRVLIRRLVEVSNDTR